MTLSFTHLFSALVNELLYNKNLIYLTTNVSQNYFSFYIYNTKISHISIACLFSLRKIISLIIISQKLKKNYENKISMTNVVQGEFELC